MADENEIIGILKSLVLGDDTDTQNKIEAIKDAIVEVNKLGDAMKHVSTTSKALIAVSESEAYLKSWAQATTLIAEAAEAQGTILTNAEKERLIRNEATTELQAQLAMLTRTTEMTARRIASLNMQREALRAQVHLGVDVATNEDQISALDKDILRYTTEINNAREKGNEEQVRALANQIRINKAVDDLSKKTEDMVGNVTGIGLQWRQSFVGAIAESMMAVDGFENKINVMAEGLSEGFATALTPLNIFMSSLQKVIEMTVVMAFKVDETTVAFRKAYTAGEEFDQLIIKSYRDNYDYAISMDDTGKAFGSVITNMRALRKEGADAVAEMATFVGPLANIGISANTGALALENLTAVMGKSATEAKADILDFAAFAKSIGAPAEEVVKDFNDAMPALAAFGNDAIKVFKGLEAQAAATGVEMSKLSQIALKFDTFQDAASNAGMLNAVLGGAYFNSLEMLNASHEDRIKLMVQGFQATGKSFSQLGYYEQKAIAAAMGIANVADAQKILTHGMGEFHAMEAEAKAHAEAEKEMQDMMKENITITNQFAHAMKQFGEAFEPLLLIMREFMNVISFVMKGVGWLLSGFGSDIGKAIIGITAFTIAIAALAFHFNLLGVASYASNWKMAAFVITMMLIGKAVLAPLHSPPLYIGIFILAAGFFLLGRASDAAGPSALYLAGAIMIMGAGVALATLGFVALAAAMAKMSVGQMLAFAVVVGVIGAALYFVIPAILGAGVAAGISAPLLLAVGLALLMAGAGIAIVVYSIALLVDSFTKLIAVMAENAPQLTMLVLGFTALAMTGWFAGLALGAIALGFGALALALAFIRTDDLIALGQIFSGLGKFAAEGAEGVGKLPSTIKQIAEELTSFVDDLEDAPSKLNELAGSFERLAAATTGIKGIGTLDINTASTPGGATENITMGNRDLRQAVSETQITKIITQNTLATRESVENTRETLQVIKETLGNVAAAATIGPNLGEGILIRDQVVFDFGDFNYRHTEKVKEIIENEVKQSGGN